MPEDLLTDFERSLEALVGQPVWGIVPGDGTAISLELGEKVRLAERIRNSSLPEEVRSHEGRFSLFFTCPWRLEAPQRIVCGSGDDMAPDGEPARSLDAIAGARVTSIRAAPPVLDLVLHLDNGLVLRTFCEVGHSASEDNYSVFIQDSVYTVGAASTIRCERRAPNPARNLRAVE